MTSRDFIPPKVVAVSLEGDWLLHAGSSHLDLANDAGGDGATDPGWSRASTYRSNWGRVRTAGYQEEAGRVIPLHAAMLWVLHHLVAVWLTAWGVGLLILGVVHG